ncbi:uncharacterized protein LOC126268103 [Schistocerca gregaria]|uniref:uncharacterized protein LOC126268103 n=1 Tax=Schistocerca gregaria TaxID=7010 RepID=UPI00211E8FE2|nr:uncharacterized protein LOC126268103 [Schistocerca gregaria]XP_049829572.1 uncharacterized protein LOC126268103 [Schistocerca gregaria]
MCKYHYNFMSILECLSKTVPSNHKKLLNELSCNSQNDDCVFGSCQECQIKLSKFIPEDLTETIVWRQWENEAKHRPCLSEHSGSCDDALASLVDTLTPFKKHCYMKIKLNDFFQGKKNSLDVEECVLQMDFAQNYALISQDEVQSAHWASNYLHFLHLVCKP